MVVFLKGLKRYLTWIWLLKRNSFKSDTWYFVLNFGIGDAYIVSALLPEFIKLNGPAVLIFEKRTQSFIPKLFIEKLNDFKFNLIPSYLIEEFGGFKKGQPIYLHPLKLYDAKLVSIVGLNGIHLVEMYKIILGLKMTCSLKKPVFPKFTDGFIEKTFLEYSLIVGKTVMLCPQATSIGLLDSNFWIDLANKITDRGLKVVYMNFSESIGNYQSVSFPLEYSKQFCDTAGYIISLRSGFCDLIATSSSKKVILYPDIEYFSGKLIDSTGLYRMGLTGAENLLEVVLNEETTSKKIVETILNFINE